MKEKRTPRLAETTRLIDYPLYFYYKKQKNVKKENKAITLKEFKDIVSKIWEVSAQKLLEKEGGVVLKGIGYLCHWMTPCKRVFKSPVRGGYDLNANYHTDGYFYNTELFSNIFKTDRLKGWGIDKTMNKGFKHSLCMELKAGKKYKIYYNMVKKIYTNKYTNI